MEWNCWADQDPPRVIEPHKKIVGLKSVFLAYFAIEIS
jgi:hypothetical protein